MKAIPILLLTCFCSLSSHSFGQKFSWTPEADSTREELNLSQEEVIILASIVEKETKLADEKPRIARVYLNRLDKDMYLEADPTILFANKGKKKKRISGQELRIDSPYNTYLHKGLPPGPICKPSSETIQAVLYAEKHNYLFFSADPDLSGHFKYAETFQEHMEHGRQFLESVQKGKNE